MRRGPLSRSQLRGAMLVTVLVLSGVLGYLGSETGALADGWVWDIAALWGWWLVVPASASLVINRRLPTRRLKQPYLGPRITPLPFAALKPQGPSLN